MAYPHHLNPDRPIQLRGHALTVRFSDRVIYAVRLASWNCSRGLNRPFPHSPPCPACTTDLWACFERGLVVSDLGYVVVWWFVQRAVWHGGTPWFCLPARGKNVFSALISIFSTVERTASQCMAASPSSAGTGHRRSWPLLVHGVGDKE
jgi:hypothetical protein